MNFVTLIRSFLKKFQDRFPPFQIVNVSNSFPKSLKKKRIYVLLEDGEPWEARFLCPCGCGDALDLSLLADDHPTWTAKSGINRRATLHPSIWRKAGCLSHFFIRDGKVIWI